MHIVHIIDTLRSGGRERQLVELLKGLSKKVNVKCDLIVMSDEIHYTYLSEYNIGIHKLIRNSKHDISIFFRLYKLINSLNPDILHSWGSMCSVYCLPFLLLSKKPFINGFLRNAPPNWNWRNKDWIRCFSTFPFSDAIIANSNVALDIYKVPTEKAYCIHNGFDFERVGNIKEPYLIKEQLGVVTPNVVGMVASFSKNKDYLAFINCALAILKERSDITFIAIGDGENKSKCENLIPEEYKKNFVFTGKILNTEEVINIFNVGMLLSNIEVHGEGISNSIMEYMALGKPVIASDCGGNKELIIDGETGYIVPANSCEQVVPKIIELLDNQELSSGFGNAGYERINKYFNFPTLINEYLDIYNEQLSREVK